MDKLSYLFEKLDYLLTRFLIRSFRIACGAVFFWLAFVCVTNGEEITSEPFASLTIKAVLHLAFYFGATYYLCWFGWMIAFGEGPTEEEREKQKEEEAKRQAQLEESDRLLLEQVKKHLMKASQTVGGLFKNTRRRD